MATWIEDLNNILRSFYELANNTQFTGNCANKVKEYLYDTYVGETNIPQLLIATMQAMSAIDANGYGLRIAKNT